MTAIHPQSLQTVAVPDLHTYQGHTGIGRVFQSIRAEWDGSVRLVNASFVRVPMPILRNNPWGVRVPENANLVLLPKLTGAQALRHSSGIPGVVVVHDIGIVDLAEDGIGLNRLTRRSILSSLRGLQYAARIVTVSHFTRDRLVDHMPTLAERIRVVPNGVHASFLTHRRSQPESTARITRLVGHAPGAPLLLNVGSEAPRKNMSLLLQVYRQVRQRYPNARLLKVGQPGQLAWRKNTLSIAEELGLQIGEDIIFLEDVDDSTLADLYCAADVFLSTSLYEGFGLPALEAMAVGTPVVVTTCGALPEIVGEVGWVVPPEVEPFVQAIEEALADAGRPMRGERARARAATYTWSHAAARYLDIMNEVFRPAREGERLL